MTRPGPPIPSIDEHSPPGQLSWARLPLTTYGVMRPLSGNQGGGLRVASGTLNEIYVRGTDLIGGAYTVFPYRGPLRRVDHLFGK